MSNKKWFIINDGMYSTVDLLEHDESDQPYVQRDCDGPYKNFSEAKRELIKQQRELIKNYKANIMHVKKMKISDYK